MVRVSTIGAVCLLLAACQQDGDGAASGNGAAAGQPASKSAEQGKQSIAESLAATSDHGRFVNALKAAGLDGTLSGAQPYTVFAPTDAAFEGIEGDGDDALLAPENKARLVALLTGHIVPGVVTAEDLGKAIDRGKNKAQIATVGGANLTFTRLGDGIAVSGPDGKQGRISGPGKIQSNGAIHPIDIVLMPN